MGERLRRTAAREPGRAVGVLAAVAVLGTALAAGWTDRLALSTGATPKAPLKIRVAGELPVDSGPFRIAVQTMRSQLSANPAVADARERRVAGQPRSTLLIVRFGVGGQRRDAAIARIQQGLDPGPLVLTFRGEAASVRGAKDAAVEDLYLLLFALPLVALLAVATLGLRPGGAALLAAGAASALAALATELLGGAFDVSWLALVGAVAGGGLITLQLCAMARAGADSAALVLAALAGAAPFAAMALLGVDYLASLGLGGALGSLIAAPAAQLAAGAGEGYSQRDESEPPEAATEQVRSRFWHGVGDLLGWSAAISLLITAFAVAVLAFAVAPVDGLAVAALGTAAPPEISGAELAAAIGAVAVATAALTSFSGLRIGLAIAGTLVFALPAAAVAGLLVASIQEGELEGPLDYASTGVLQLGSLAGAVAVVASVCAAQLVTLAAAAWRTEGFATSERAGEATAHIGPAATLVCGTGIACGVALAFSRLLFVKEFGLGIAAGLLLELAVIHVLIAPGLLRQAPERVTRQ